MSSCKALKNNLYCALEQGEILLPDIPYSSVPTDTDGLKEEGGDKERSRQREGGREREGK